MRLFKQIIVMAVVIMATLGCEKIENPSRTSSSLRFRVDVENREIVTKALGNGPEYFYLFGWYRGGNEHGAAGISYYTSSKGAQNWEKYTLRDNGDYVVEGGSTVEDNPEWHKAQFKWEEGTVLSKFWACTNWGTSLPNLQATAHGGADEEDLFKVSYLSYDKMLDAAQQTDFMIAYSRQSQTDVVVDDILRLTFKHTLSKITFVDKSGGEISSLKVGGTYESGNLEYTSAGVITWSQGGNPWRPKTMTGGNGSMYLIPQTFSAENPLEITIELKDGTTKSKKIESAAWEAGYEYTYNLNVTKTKAGEGIFSVECISESGY